MVLGSIAGLKVVMTIGLGAWIAHFYYFFITWKATFKAMKLVLLKRKATYLGHCQSHVDSSVRWPSEYYIVMPSLNQ